MFRKPVLILLALLCLFAAMFASASTASANGSGNVILVDTLDDTRHWEGNCSLRDAIMAANTNRAQDGCKAGWVGHDTIEFAPALQGHMITLLGGQLDIYEPVTIQGHVKIDAQYRSRIFKSSTEGQVALSGLTLMHGKADSGAGILVSNGSLKLYHITMRRNQAIQNGGAISFPASESGRLIITSSDFTHNTAWGDGGAIYASGIDVNIYNGRFEHNYATAHGGALYGENARIFTEITTYYRNNSRMGGAIYETNSFHQAFDNTFELNTAGSHGGGMMFVGGEARITKGWLDNNRSGRYGGAIAATEGAYLIISQTYMQLNRAERAGGALFSMNSTINISRSGIVLSWAGQNGGGLYAGMSTFYVRNTDLLYNQAVKGGGIYSHAAYLSMNTVSLIANEADIGGGLYSTVNPQHPDSEITMSHVKIHNNDARNGAGIAHWIPANVSGNSTVVLYDSEIFDNTGLDGTALFNHNAETYLFRTSVYRNAGNAINNPKGKVTLTQATLYDNQYNNCKGTIAMPEPYTNQDSDGSCMP
ncbi:MAG: hypothetical protein ACPG8W_22755 [Candidatus Promineifilaceae bacterium]